jgi:hypothetical protein
MHQSQLLNPVAGVAQPPSILDDQIDLTNSHGGDKQSDALVGPSMAPSKVGERADSDELHPLHAAGDEDESAPHDDGDAHDVVAVTAGAEDAADGDGDEPAATPIDRGDGQMPVTVATDGDHYELLHTGGDEQEAVAENGGAEVQVGADREYSAPTVMRFESEPGRPSRPTHSVRHHAANSFNNICCGAAYRLENGLVEVNEHGS